MIPVMVVPILTRPELLYRMLSTVDATVERLVVIDNGLVVNRHALDAALLDAPGHIYSRFVLSMPTNLGVAASWNLGIKSSPYAPWWMISNFDVTFPRGSLDRLAEESESGALTLAQASPPWSCFTIGENVVAEVGLFDEGFYPAYYEDLDYTRRCASGGAKVVHSTAPVHHDNSSTLMAGYGAKNDRTFPHNRAYHDHKASTGDMSAGTWSLTRRRLLSWD